MLNETYILGTSNDYTLCNLNRFDAITDGSTAIPTDALTDAPMDASREVSTDTATDAQRLIP